MHKAPNIYPCYALISLTYISSIASSSSRITIALVIGMCDDSMQCDIVASLTNLFALLDIFIVVFINIFHLHAIQVVPSTSVVAPQRIALE